MSAFRFLVNGDPTEIDVPGMRRLLDVLREDLGLTGTKEGCGEGCGACTVLLDGVVVDSCLVPICQVDGSMVRTVEGLARPAATLGGTPELDELQTSFLELGGAQCGICTPGMLMAAGRTSTTAAAGRGRDPRGDRREPLPVHRLHQDHRFDRRFCPRAGRTGGMKDGEFDRLRIPLDNGSNVPGPNGEGVDAQRTGDAASPSSWQQVRRSSPG